LRLALLPAIYRPPYVWRPYILDTPQKRKHDRRACEIRKAQANQRRDELASAQIAANMRRAAHIRAELAKLGLEL
jgi:hypothetical protein